MLAASDICRAAQTITATIKSLSFDAKQVEAHVGDAVVWANSSPTNHIAVSDNDGKTFGTGEFQTERNIEVSKLREPG